MLGRFGHFDQTDLEREMDRLLVLICCKIKRKDMILARDFAGELFQLLTAYSLHRKTKKEKRRDTILLHIIMFFLCLFISSISCLVMNTATVVCFKLMIFSVHGIVLAIFINAWFADKFGKTLEKILDSYDSQKQSFIEAVLQGLHAANVQDLRTGARDGMVSLLSFFP